MKRFIYIIIAATLLISLPLYAATRLILPDWLATKISTSLPEGAELKIGNVSSNSDLSIVYKNVTFSINNFRATVPELVVVPNLNIKNPLLIIANTMNVEMGGDEVELIGSEIKLFLGEQNINNFQLNGTISALESSVDFWASNINFLILGVFSEQRKFIVSSEKAVFKLKAPLGQVGITLKSVTTDIAMDKELELNLKAEAIELDLGGLYSLEEAKLFNAENLETDFKLFKKSEWLLPISFHAKNIRYQEEEMFGVLNFSGTGRWGPGSRDCNFSDIKSNSKKCDKLIDLLNMNLILEDGLEKLVFQGNGYCVAPRSGCRQRISASIMGKGTANIFSNIMQSGTLNPLVGGILLGSMLSSPLETGDAFDHSINLAVEGSQIFINGEPLIK